MNNIGRTTDATFWKALYSGTCASWDSDYGNRNGYGNGYYDSDWNTRKTKREHKFSPVLLIITTVWNCSECGKKKEDCLTNYCDDEPPEF